MSGNGLEASSENIHTALMMGEKFLKSVILCVFSAAVPSTLLQGLYAVPIALGLIQTTGMSTSVFVS